MIGNPTYFQNNSRIITGTNNFVFDNDVVLLCDTSTGAVNLTLLEIPADRFSTQYKIYVVDQSNNAGTNNITIIAPTGFSVNNASTCVVNVNSGVATITISSNKTYNAQFNYVVGGGGAIVVKNEGTIITTNATSFDFVGADVNATAIGGDVTINVQSSFVLLNYATLQTLVLTNALVPSQQYLITDAIFVNSPVENVPIVVEAITTNEITLLGSGIFLNADYQGVGDYSGVSGFVSNLGIWDIALTPVIGDVVIWNNLNWVNLTGANGGSPDTTPLDWSLLSKSSTNGYIQEIDIIKYNYSTNQISYREDVRNNKVENNLQTYGLTIEAFLVFQWGYDATTENSVLSESAFQIWNNNKVIFGNSLSNNSVVTFAQPNTSRFVQNTFINNAIISVIVSDGTIVSNSFESMDMHLYTRTNTSSIARNIFKFGSGHSVDCVVSQATIYENTIYGGKTAMNIVNQKDFYRNTILFSEFVIGSNSGYFYNNNIQHANVSINENTGTFTDNVIYQSNFNIVTNLGDIFSNNINGGSSIAVSTTQVGSEITYNNLTSASSLQLTDNLGNISSNLFLSGSYITMNNNSGRIENNVLNQSSFDIKDNTSQIISNQLTNSVITLQSITSFFIENVWVKTSFTLTGDIVVELSGTLVEGGSLSMPTLLTKIIGGVYQNNIGTIIYPLDMTDPAIYDIGTKTLIIPVGLQNFIGEYWLFFGGTFDIEKIQNLNQKFATKFVNKEIGTTKTFKTLTSVAFATIDEMISPNVAPALFRITGRSSGEDSIYIRRLGDLNGIEQNYIYA